MYKIKNCEKMIEIDNVDTWNAASYPATGVYHNTNVNTNGFPIVFVSKESSIVVCLNESQFNTLFEKVEENKKEIITVGVISEITLLKAIAISQKPELALELIK